MPKDYNKQIIFIRSLGLLEYFINSNTCTHGIMVLIATKQDGKSQEK